MIIITAASFTAITTFADITIATIVTVITIIIIIVIVIVIIAIIIVGIFVVVSVTSWIPNFALVTVKEHLLIRSHCRKEASPIH